MLSTITPSPSLFRLTSRLQSTSSTPNLDHALLLFAFAEVAHFTWEMLLISATKIQPLAKSFSKDLLFNETASVSDFFKP